MDIRFINVEHSVKFKNIEQAENEANRLKMVLDRFAKKTKLAFTCIICISELSLKCGEYAAFHNGKRGRPKRREVSKLEPFASVAKVPPHLHIMIAYTRQEKAISEKIVNSIIKRYGEASSKAYDITNTSPLYFLQYIVRQSVAFRYVADFTNSIALDFKKLCRVSTKQLDNFYFHTLYRKDSRKEHAVRPLDVV